MNALGKHLLLEFKDCNEEVLDGVDFLQHCLNDAAVACGATVVGQSFYHFSPYGVSGVVNIAESHISIHTWPEYKYAAVDIFTCGDRVEPEKAIALIAERLGTNSYSAIELRRGIVMEAPARRVLK
ncbi:MAG: adenosylmethionine decarboxylase [Chloroflexota bacterium]|nr:adenosylmethionine decarboxylase [Chloroflexota bacterium]